MSPAFSRAAALRFGFAFAAVTAAPRIVRAADPIPLQVGAMPTDGSAEAAYALDRGWFKAAGLDVTLTTMTNTASLAAAVQGGSLAIGFGSVIPLAEAKARGIGFRVIWPAATYKGAPSPNLLMVAKNSPVQHAADLNGKTVAVNGLRDLTQYEVQAWIDKNGGDVKSVKLVEIPFSEMGTALAAGRVDAAILAEPFLSAAKGEARVLGDANEAIAPHYAITCWFATEGWLKSNPQVGKRYASVMQQTARWANAHREESAAILGRISKLSPDVLAVMTRSYYGEAKPDPAMFQPPINAAMKYGTLASIEAADLLWSGS